MSVTGISAEYRGSACRVVPTHSSDRLLHGHATGRDTGPDMEERQSAETHDLLGTG